MTQHDLLRLIPYFKLKIRERVGYMPTSHHLNQNV